MVRNHGNIISQGIAMVPWFVRRDTAPLSSVVDPASGLIIAFDEMDEQIIPVTLSKHISC